MRKSQNWISRVLTQKVGATFYLPDASGYGILDNCNLVSFCLYVANPFFLGGAVFGVAFG